ncbi:MAG TPA: Npt1/Npt2 family nucleotide transporter [Vicinamibacterales bacterium]
MGTLLKRLLRPIVDVTEQESITLLLMFAYSFLAMTAYTILKPITRSQFIASLGAENIPYMPLLAGVAIGVIMQGYSRAAGLLPPKWVIPVAQLIMAALLAGFWFFFQTGHWTVAAGFYLFGLIMGILLISQFWTLANEIYDPRQAKRLFGFIGAGASLGGIAGSSILRFLVARVGTNDLLLVSAAILVVCAAIVVTVEMRAGSLTLADIASSGEEKGVGGSEALQMLRESKHLQIIALVIAFGAIGANLIEQQLNMAAEAFKGRTQVDSLTAFLGTVQLYTSMAGFFIQIFLTSRIHRQLGIGFALLVLPVSLGSTAAIMLANAALWAPALARVLDTSLRYTVDKTTREILFLPLPSHLKQRAKPFVDVTVDRLAKGVSALLALVLISPWGLALDWQQVSYASLVICGLWIYTAIRAKRGYIAAFRHSIERREMEPEAVRLPVADLSTIETLVAELADPDEKRVLYAIDVLESLDKRNLITPLLLYHESAQVRARALKALSAAPRDVASKWRESVRRMLTDDSTEVRAAAIGALAAIGDESETELARPYLDEPNPRLAATAAVVMAQSSSETDRQAAEAALTRLLTDPAERSTARRELAVALRQIRDPRTSALLVPLLGDANPAVASEAMRTLRNRGETEFIFVPALVSLLRDRRLKGDAREVLVSYGEPVVDTLAHFLTDPYEDIWVRRHIPATLARIPSQRSMDVLVRALDGERDGFLRFKLVSAIDRLRSERPELTFDPRPIQTLLMREGTRYYEYLSLHYNLYERARLPREGLLDEALAQKIERSRNRVFLLLGLLYPRQDIAAARWALEHGDGRARASASEYLDNVLDGNIRKRLMPMLEDLPVAERVRKGNAILNTRERDVEETLLRLINDEDEVVSAAAIDFAGRNRMLSLADDIEHVLAHRDVRDWHVFEAASWTLAGFRLASDRRRSLWLEPLPAVEMADRLRGIPIFNAVTVDELFRIARTGRQVLYDGGTVVFQEGQLPTNLYFLLDGQVRMTSTTGGSHDVTPPAPLGMEEALVGRPFEETARTVEKSVFLQLTMEEAATLLADNTDLVQGLFRWVLDHDAFKADRIVVRGEGLTTISEPPDTPLKPIDIVLVLQRVSLFARMPPDARLALAAIVRQETLVAGQTLVVPSSPPALHVVLDGRVVISGADGEEEIEAGPGDSIGVFEAFAGLPLGRTVRVTAGGRALRLTHDDLFDLLGQQPDLLTYVFATLFGARRAEWGLSTADLAVRKEAAPETWREAVER